MIQSENIEPNVDLVRLGDRQIYLVGTAHISKASADLVEKIIRQVKPDCVAVELCESRYKSLRDPERWRNTDIISVIKEGRAYVLLAQLLLAAFQKKLGSQLDITPGAEMMRALSVAEETKCTTSLADREVKVTLKRTWASLGLWSSAKVIATALGALFGDKKIEAEEIERLKSVDALEELMREFSSKLPDVRVALIDERDQYLAHKIRNSPGDKIVAVIGAGHVPGIKNWLDKEIDIASLEVLPPRGIWGRVISWSILFLVLGMFAAGFFSEGLDKILEMFGAWFWITGFSGAVGAAISLAHPLSVITAFIVTPFTTLHPFLASGWVTGLVEAWLRKPRVSDFQSIADDILTFRGVLSNRLSRILAVMVITNISSSIGMIVATGTVASLI